MQKITDRYKDKNITQTASLVDKKTGVAIPVDGTLIIRKSTGKIEATHKEYAYLNLESLRYIVSKGIKQVDLGLIMTLTSTLLHGENICMQLDDEEPHTSSTIGELIGETQHSAKTKLNRLIKMNLIDYAYVKVGLRKKKVYMLNPFLIKKGRELNANLKTSFNPIINLPGNKSLKPNTDFLNV